MVLQRRAGWTRTLRALVVSAVTAAYAGCGPVMESVPMDATPAMWETLAGDWRGEYTMTGHDRRGLISFRLEAAAQAAFGDVLMIPEHHAWPYGPRQGGNERPARREADTASQLLRIRFVSAEHGMLRGAMSPYWDPDRQCQATASFVGSIRAGAIEGSLSSVCEDGVRTLNGRWHVGRRRR